MAKTSDVVVLGGGVVGCAAAYYIAGEGLSVTVIERDSIASHASGFAYGGLTPVMGVYIDDPLVPLSQHADDLHGELAEVLPADTGVDTEYRDKPSLTLAITEDEIPEIKTLFDWLTEHHAADVDWLEGADLLTEEPRLSPEIPVGMFTDLSHEVEPYKFTLALATGSEQRGVVFENAEVTGLRIGADGGIEGVDTTGDSYDTEDVVVAIGPWSAAAGEWAGVKIPISPLKGEILRLAAPGDPLAISMSWKGNYATTKPDGLLWAGTTEVEAGFDESVTTDGRDQIMEALVGVLPYLADARLSRQTACLRPVAPDGLPILGPVGDIPGLWIATGTGRKGILLGPGMGQVISDLIVGKIPAIDVGPLSLDRFAE